MNRQVRVAPFSRNLLASGGMAVLLAVAFALYLRSETLEDRATELRQRSLQLADEVRQSGDDLTLMVRAYVATGDPVYKQHAQDILDIRDGRKPRPKDYRSPGWDLIPPGGPAPHPERQQTIALLELMRQEGFTEDESRKLAEARAYANARTVRELEALRLVESPGPDAEATLARARRMLYDGTYDEARSAVMKPLQDFLALVDQRTLAAVRAAETRDSVLTGLIVAVGLGLLFSLWRTYATMRDTLGGGLDEVHAQIARIGRGDPFAAITLRAGREDSVLAWLSAMQARLNDRAGERAQAEAALRESERRYSDMLGNVHLVSVMLDQRGRVTFCNDFLLRLTGWRREEVLGSDWFDRFVPAGSRDVQDEFEALLDDLPTAWHHENEILTRSGERRMIRWNNSVLCSASGVVVGTASIGEDITERQRAEASLRLALERLRRFVDANIIGILIGGASGTISEANDYYLRLTGHTRDELLHGHIDWRAITPSEWLPADEQAIRELRERGTSTPYEKEYLRPDGTRVPVLVAIALLPGPGEEIAAFALDLTRGRHAEEAWRESEIRYRALVETAPSAVFVIQGDRVVVANQSCLQLFGATAPGQLLGRSPFDLFQRDSHSTVRTRLQHVRSEGETVPLIEATITRLDGTPVDVEVTAAPFQAQGVNAIHVMLRDITERKQAEAKMAEQLAELRRWHDVMVGRESRVLELKREVNDLLARAGEQIRYTSVVDGQ